jgi:hypothetical protein
MRTTRGQRQSVFAGVREGLDVQFWGCFCSLTKGSCVSDDTALARFTGANKIAHDDNSSSDADPYV